MVFGYVLLIILDSTLLEHDLIVHQQLVYRVNSWFVESTAGLSNQQPFIKEDPRKNHKTTPKQFPNQPNPPPNQPKTCSKTIPFIPQEMVPVALQES